MVKKQVSSMTGWRIEGTLREFPKFSPVNLWFDYPIHKVDYVGVLKDINTDDQPTWKKNFPKKKSAEEVKKEKNDSLETAFSAVNFEGEVKIKDLIEYMGVSEKTIRRRLKEHGGFWIDEGKVGQK